MLRERVILDFRLYLNMCIYTSLSLSMMKLATCFDRHCFDQLEDSVFELVLLFIDRPSYFSIVMFANAVSLFCRSVGVNGTCDRPSAARTKVKQVRVNVLSYHVRFVIFSSIDRLSYFSIVMFATASAVSFFVDLLM